jgi:hypothetical protein
VDTEILKTEGAERQELVQEDLDQALLVVSGVRSVDSGFLRHPWIHDFLKEENCDSSYLSDRMVWVNQDESC